jgi:hypothetical protein
MFGLGPVFDWHICVCHVLLIMLRGFCMPARVIRFLNCVLLCLTVAACSQNDAPITADPPTHGAAFETPISNQTEIHEEESGEHSHGEDTQGEHSHIDPALATAEMGVALVPSELVVGLNRFAVGLFDAESQVVHDAEVHFHYYDLTNANAPVLESHAEAIRRQTPDGLTTIFTQDREFDRAGDWGVEVQASFADGSASVKRIGFKVLPDSPAPLPGEAAPSVETAVASDVDNDLSKLSSSLTPNPAFYEQSLSDALTNGKPTVLLFATPAFCQTRFCGPAYEMTSELQTQYADQMNFIHVEIYSGLPDPSVNNWQLAPAMEAFGLSTEPWLYLLDSSGVVVYRVEGLFTVEEVEQYIPAVLDPS